MQASDLHTVCGAEVYLKFRPEEGGEWDGYRSKIIQKRNVKTQIGESLKPANYSLRSNSVTTVHTPKKLKKSTTSPAMLHQSGKPKMKSRTKPKRQAIVTPPVHNIPTKKSKSSDKGEKVNEGQ